MTKYKLIDEIMDDFREIGEATVEGYNKEILNFSENDIREVLESRLK